MARPEIGRVVLMPNPAALKSGLAEHTQKQLISSKRLHVKNNVIILPTLPGGLQPNAEQLHSTLEEGDVIGALCGDGSFWFIVGGLVMSGLADHVSVASLGGGNARDIGRATQRRRGVRPDVFLARAHAERSFALRSDITFRNNTETYYAASYMGWGKTAIGAAMVDTDEYRNGWKLRQDWRVGTSTLNSEHTFTMVDEQGAEHTLGDLTVAKSSSIAKIFHPPIEPWDKQMWVARTSPGTGRAWGAMGGLLVGSSLPAFGAYHDEPYSFEITTKTPYHYDGETRRPAMPDTPDEERPPIILLPGTRVDVGLDAQSYLLLTDRFAA